MVTRVLKRVLGQVRYTVFAVVIATMVLSSSLLLPNLGAILQVFAANVPLSIKVSFVFSLYGTIATNFSTFSAVNLVVISILFGMNLALLVYYIRRQQVTSRNVTAKITSFGGLVSGLLGIGCAACGSVVITGLLGTIGAGGALSLLPFHGSEFGLLGVVFLVISIRYLIVRINDPQVCRVDL